MIKFCYCNATFHDFLNFRIRYKRNIVNILFRTCSNIQVKKKDVSIETLPKAYKPKDIENGWYEWWESNGFFKPRLSGKPFSLLLPPPNVTGTLHLGHALTGTIQDIIVRWRRMKGDSVLWIPGVDHAGIATQVVVEKCLAKEIKKTKHDLGREKFVEEVWKWKQEKGDCIVEQLRTLGLSLDWTREVFTMDPLPTEAVKAAFIHLFDTGMIYKADAHVNWSCALQSSISDIEVEIREIAGPTLLNIPGCPEPVEFGVLTYIAYRVHNDVAEVVVATTRPETLLGDTAVALHPEDPRRSQLEGKSVWHPFRNRPIPIIFDSFVDPNFGTGAVKVTPAHNAIDWQVGLRHNLETVRVFDEMGMVVTAPFMGKHRFEARKLVLEELKNLNLFRGIKNHNMQIPFCSRSGDVIELMLKPQWFVKCQAAAEKAVKAVKMKQLILEPENYERVWFNWLENVRDWNISRQLWWGHRIPAYEAVIRGGGEKIWVAAGSEDEARRKASTMLNTSEDNVSLEPDPDVLDTWFSSALFPLYSLGWPKCGTEFRERFPFSLLETGNDIIFFWVARMVIMSIMLSGSLPFERVVLHGVVCDARGRKMSKSLGNVLSAEEIIYGASLHQLAAALQATHARGLLTDAELQTSIAGQKKNFPDGIPECGVDALRFTLCSQSIQSSNVSFDVPTCYTNKLFCNKILQAFRFFISSLSNETASPSVTLRPQDMTSFDLWITSRLAATISEVNNSLEVFHFHTATQAIRHFMYAEFCDVYLEAVKPILRSNEEPARMACLSCLFNCLETALRLLHPFMPYLSEELYQRLPPLTGFTPSESIMIAEFPDPEKWSSWRSPQIDDIVSHVQDIVSVVRKMKALFGTKGEKPYVMVATSNSELIKFLNCNILAVKAMARASDFSVHSQIDEKLMSGSLKEIIHQNTTIFTKLPNEKRVRKERLEPTLKREEKLLLQIKKLEKLMVKDREKVSVESRARNMSKMKALQLQLDKILEIKKLLQEERASSISVDLAGSEKIDLVKE